MVLRPLQDRTLLRQVQQSEDDARQQLQPEIASENRVMHATDATGEVATLPAA